MTEGFGGQCPNCGYTKMFQRIGSSGYWNVDYCPKCGFGCGYADGDDAASHGDKTLDQVLHGLNHMLVLDEYLVTREGLFNWIENHVKDDRPSCNAFQYSKEEIEKIMESVEDKTIYGIEKVMLT
jgi:hypothetical protein